MRYIPPYSQIFPQNRRISQYTPERLPSLQLRAAIFGVFRTWVYVVVEGDVVMMCPGVTELISTTVMTLYQNEVTAICFCPGMMRGGAVAFRHITLPRRRKARKKSATALALFADSLTVPFTYSR
jgi:hypothetical protein